MPKTVLVKTRAAADLDAPPEAPSDDSPGEAAPRSTRATRRVRRLEPRRARPSVMLPPPWTGPLDVADAGTMVGRQAELAALKKLWAEVMKGSTRTVLIAGDPGVGKTRLAAELICAADACGAKVLVGRCRRDGAVPYEPVVEALGPALREQSDGWLRAHVRRHGTALVRLVPDLAPRLNEPLSNTQVDGRSQLLGSVAAAITGLGRPPVVLVLEDLHWATRSTVLVLDHLIRTCSSAPLLILGTYREAAIHPSHPLADLLDGPLMKRVERMVLPNLSIQSVTALLVDRSAVAGRAASTLARSLWRTTEGNPLLLTEVVRDLAAGGGLATGTVKTEAVDKVGVAHEISELTARRLGRSSSATRKAVEAASVVGASFSGAAVAQLTGEKPEDAANALAKAVKTAVIVRVDGKTDEYRFAHDRFREAAYDFLPPNRRVRLHHDMAMLLDQPGAPETPPAVLVHHLAGAAPVGSSPDAVRHAQRAGQAAADVLAFEEAAASYGQALAFLGGGGDAGQRADLLMLLADSNHRAGESARARQSYLQASAVARAHGDGPRLGRAVLGLGDVLGVWGGDGQLIGLLDEAVAANPEDPSLRAKLIARLAHARSAFDSPDQLKAQSDRAWELAWDSKDPDTMGTVLRSRHEALSAPDDLEDRAEIDGELWAMANNANDSAQLLLAYGWRLVDLLEQGHLVDADRDRKLHAQLARRSGDPRHQRDAAMWAAMWALLEGRSRKALTETDKALALGQQARDPEASSIYWTQQLDLLADWGGDGEIDGLLDVWRDLAHGHDQDPAWRASLALLLARTGRRDQAAAELEDLCAEDGADLPLDRNWLATVAAIGEVAADLGDRRCAAISTMLSPYARRLIVVGPGTVCRGSVARVLGRLSAVTGNWVAAERQFQAALSAHDRVNARPLLARTRYDFGRSLARKRGGPLHVGRVTTTLDQAIEEAEHLGLVRLAAQARAERAELT